MEAKDGIFVGGWGVKLGLRHPAACHACGGTGALFQMDTCVDGRFMILDRYLCPGCNGMCCKDKVDYLPHKIDIEYNVEPAIARGRIGELEGDSLSGSIVRKRGKAVHFQQGP